MSLIDHLQFKFWDHDDVSQGPHKYIFNFRKMWKWTVLLTLAVALIPLLVVTFLDYRMGRRAIESEILLRTGRLVSNTRRSVSYFHIEREAALNFVVTNDPFESLVSPSRLESVLASLKSSFGGFVDLGVINADGLQLTYAGPYELEGKNYREAEWFQKVVSQGIYISDVFLGFRNVPHMVVAVKHTRADGGFYVLRATLDTTQFNQMLTELEVDGEGDAFLINHEGILQTPSRHEGMVLDRFSLQVPEYSERSQVILTESLSDTPLIIGDGIVGSESEKEPDNPSLAAPDHKCGPLVIGYAYIPETPFILMIIKHKDRLMAPWNSTKLQLIGFLVISIFMIAFVILSGITYLVNQIYLADQRRLLILHEAEYANKMASLGRLSAGVAHEINNPLAIINEKAGLIKDLLTYNPEAAKGPKLKPLLDAVIASVERCARITRRLLNFARQSEMKMITLDLKTVIQDVLSFTGKEAEYRRIDVQVEIPEDIPAIRSDQGRLQEIFLNLTTNAFAAVEDGGSLHITAAAEQELKQVAVHFADNGHGIPEKDLERIFDPFFSTKTASGGTGLGLSITYGLVQELGGTIHVESQVGTGTTFELRLPCCTETDTHHQPSETKGKEHHENPAG